MDDVALARKMRRVPSIEPALLRGVASFLEVRRESPRMSNAQELAALLEVVVLTAQAAAAVTRLGWHGMREFERRLPSDLGWAGACKQLAAIGSAAVGARFEMMGDSKAGRPVSDLTMAVWMLAELIERGGGTVDARQGGELCQAFAIALELAGLSIANHRETVRAALARRDAKQ